MWAVRQSKLFLLITIAYVALVLAYVVFVTNSTLAIALRLPDMDLPETLPHLFFGYLLALAPLIWFTPKRRTSKVIYVYVYFAVVIPSIIFTLTNADIPLLLRGFDAFFLVFCYFIVYAFYLLPPKRIELSRFLQRIGWTIVIGVSVLGCLYFIVVDRSMFSNVSFIDVYEKRLEIRELIESGGRDRASVYLTNWIGTAIAPFVVVWGVRHRNPALVLAGIAMAYIAFAASSHKTVFFTSVILLTYSIGIYLTRRYWGAREDYFVVALIMIVVYILAAFSLDLLIGRDAFTSRVTFRLFLNNGYLTSVYLEFFRDLPLLFYADSFMSFALDSPFNQSYARMIGDYVTRYDTQNSANANFLADGFANLGYVGMVFAALQFGLVLWIIDCAALGKDQTIASVIIIPMGLIFANLPIHTSLLNNGMFLIVLLLLLMPRVSEPRSRSLDPRPRRAVRRRPPAGRPSSGPGDRRGPDEESAVDVSRASVTGGAIERASAGIGSSVSAGEAAAERPGVAVDRPRSGGRR